MMSNRTLPISFWPHCKVLQGDALGGRGFVSRIVVVVVVLDDRRHLTPTEELSHGHRGHVEDVRDLILQKRKLRSG